MTLKKIAVILNGFIHDLATGVWLAALAAIYMLHAAHMRDTSVASLINPLERSFFWWSIGAMVAIMATGAGRTFTYIDNWYGEDAEKVRRRMLIIKHVFFLVAFSIGYLFIWGKVFH